MKILTAIAFLFLMIHSSCENYLDTKPINFVTPDNFYNNEEELTAALMAVYSELGSTTDGTYSRFLSLEAPSSNDEMVRRGANTESAADAYNASASYDRFFTSWTTLYSGIQRANLLLENIDKALVTPDIKNKIRGEALFLRAFYHFILVSYWGDVPLKLSSTNSLNQIYIARTPAKQVYDAVIKDMTASYELVDEITTFNHAGRVSKTAVAGILARVCLHAAGRLRDAFYYQNAKDWALKVIQSGIHSLNPDYKQIFINHSADIYDIKESIWEVEFQHDNGLQRNEGERFGSTIGIRNNDDKTGFMQGNYTATGVLFSLYEQGDVRRDWNIAPFYYPNFDRNNPAVQYPSNYRWGRYVAKWRREYQTKEYNKNFGGTNWPLLRYADVLLMFAEAENEINGATPQAYEAINWVRRRAYQLPAEQNSIADLPPNLSKESFFNWIKDERARELAFEGHRKLDLLRWNLLTTTIQQMLTQITTTAPSGSNTNLGYSGRVATLRPYQNFSNRDLFFPIPTQELSLNSLMRQNTGW
ncbi:RagB/SusD family nutrient uptake outer membrane protein [Pedobacter glucosidilyticus]|uniref:RagB/SusD family nutrient uptake outer membrane protein n=1 Tax=Pedobacter glucosidilyticus TaxID=1122941 RepID=UPI0026ED6571|nr:RagB/SusD family nutrient uptake outer membrane protein [Pedobacter glucosidilyticus]